MVEFFEQKFFVEAMLSFKLGNESIGSTKNFSS
jgi:hypothetical protein